MIAQAGLRRYDVRVRVNSWTGDSIGRGVKTTTDYPLQVRGERVGVRALTQKDVIAGGLYEDGDYMIGPFPPSFVGGGVEPAYFAIPADGTAREVYYKITGPGLEAGAWFTKIGERLDSAFSYTFTVRKRQAEGEP
jgi:hypothetical protein